MKANKIARQLESLRKEKQPRFRERYELSYGRSVLCESQAQWDWWDNFSKALTGGHVRAGEFSIRDLFEHLVPNGRELVETFSPRFGGTQHATTAWMEAAGAVTSSDFSSITGQIVYNALMEPLTPEAFPFQQLIPTQSTQFSGEKIAGIAMLGDVAEVVNENENYPLVGTSEDYIETPATTKRGMIVPVTKEAIFFDRTGRLLEECGKVGEALAISKEKRAIDCVIDENRTAHRYKWKGTTYASYQATSPWDNTTGSNALVDWTDIDNAEQTLNGILDPNTGEPVAIEATHLICVKALEATASRVLNATEIVVHTGGYATSGNLTETRAPNQWKSKYTILSTRLLAARLATDTTWFFGAPAKYAKYMQNWPITVTQAPAGNSDDFNRDIVTKYKASERGEYAVVQPRVMTTCTA
jgi:hypothetical protein